MAHTHAVIDSDNHFTINPVTREISNGSKKVKLMQGDHASEVFTFEIPRHVDGHDMSLCNKIAIHYINVGQIGSNPDVHLVDDASVDDAGENLIFSWLIYRTATKYPGTLNFLIKFSCVTDGIIEYQWNTDIFKGITISTGMDNEETIVEEYSDILQKWKDDILAEVPQTVKRVESLDFNNMINLRDLASGSYVLCGKFKPHTGSDTTLTFSSELLVNIVKEPSESHVQVFYPYKNCVQYLVITDSTYERTNVYLNELAVASSSDIDELTAMIK